MTIFQAPDAGQAAHAFYHVHFTPDQANRSLVYVRKIMDDLKQAHLHEYALSQRMKEIGDLPILERRIHEELRHIEDIRIRCLAELQDLGVMLRDEKLGIVNFPCWYRGREILLSWKGTESSVMFWYERYEDERRRRPIAECSSELNTAA